MDCSLFEFLLNWHMRSGAFKDIKLTIMLYIDSVMSTRFHTASCKL